MVVKYEHRAMTMAMVMATPKIKSYLQGWSTKLTGKKRIHVWSSVWQFRWSVIYIYIYTYLTTIVG